MAAVTTFGLLLALYACVASAVQTVKVQGSDFVNTVTGARLQIIGVAYQPGGSSGYKPGSDPLSNGTNCLRDAALMQQLGVNAIRVYNVDPTINHDACASIFNAVGIYMIIDVNSPLPNESLVPTQLASSYSLTYLQHIFGVVEAFHNYNNTLAFVGGNEDMNDVPSGATTPPYLRAVTRDLKSYIAKNSPRTIPVGYSAADVREILADSWSYLSCDVDGQTDDMSRIDFFGLNSYSWCGSTATFQSAGYNILMEQFSNTTIPVFFSEYGCNKVLPRVFDEVQALYGPQMTQVMSGGLVYEYVEEPNNFGLVAVFSNQTAQIRIDYDNLQSQFNKLDTKALESGNTTATKLTSPACKSSLIVSQGFNNTFDIPAMPAGAQKLISNGISNPNAGKMIPVTQTKVTQKVYGSNGKELTDLAIKPLSNDESNTPSGSNTSGPSSTTSAAASPTASKKGTASRSEVGAAALIGSAALLLVCHLL
ncbi:MAG: hypothetical protein Q9191_004713 [Dirinaria sp. TL-2023a]